MRFRDDELSIYFSQLSPSKDMILLLQFLDLLDGLTSQRGEKIFLSDILETKKCTNLSYHYSCKYFLPPS